MILKGQFLSRWFDSSLDRPFFHGRNYRLSIRSGVAQVCEIDAKLLANKLGQLNWCMEDGLTSEFQPLLVIQRVKKPAV